MAKIIDLKTFTDSRGNLTIIENIFPFDIKRVFYIYGVCDSQRGGHRHKETYQVAVCIQGSCCIKNNDGNGFLEFKLDNPAKALLLEPKDWHVMEEFTKDAILMVFASHYFDSKDYIYEQY